jgi:hypothetical protein
VAQEEEEMPPGDAHARRQDGAATLREHLARLVAYYADELAEAEWSSETERWHELILALLHRCDPELDFGRVRLAGEVLAQLGACDARELARLDSEGGEQQIVLRRVLRHHGFSDAATDRAVAVLARAGRAVSEHWDGKLQLFLSEHGERMVAALTERFAGAELADEELRYALVLWLQNTLNLPLSLDHPAVVDVRQRFGASSGDLMAAADELGLNVAIVDDLIVLGEHDDEFCWAESAGEPPRAEPDKALGNQP